MNFLNFLQGALPFRRAGGPLAPHVASNQSFAAPAGRITNAAAGLNNPGPGGPLAVGVANLASNRNNGPSAPQAFDWRNQMRRLSAALYDADPTNPGRGHLTAYDDQQRDQARETQETERSRSQLAAFADQMGLTPAERTLLVQNPVLWLQLFGPMHRQRMGTPVPPGFEFEDET